MTKPGFVKNADGYYEVPEWGGFEWLAHGFGTSGAATPDGPLSTLKQVHGVRIFFADTPGVVGEGDGLTTTTEGLLLGIKTADCLPILLIDKKNKAVAAVHAGWRGTRAGIAAAAVRLMASRWKSEPGDLEAAIGPGIGKCCFEVGPEVAREFGPWESEEKTRLDLARINRTQLEREGVGAIYESGLCTMCGTGFESFRRDREAAGRMISFVGRKQ